MKPRQISHESYTAEQLKILESVLEIKQSGKEKNEDVYIRSEISGCLRRHTW